MAPSKPTIKKDAGQDSGLKSSKFARKKYSTVRKFQDGLVDVSRKTGKFMKLFHQNQQTSALLRLPQEIRDKIFEHVFWGNKRETWPAASKRDRGGRRIVGGTTEISNVFRTCRQIQNEYRFLPYRRISIYATDYTGGKKWALSMHETFQEQVEVLHVDYRVPWDVDGSLYTMKHLKD